MAKASAMEFAVVMAKKLLISLIVWPAPRGPRWNTFSPRSSSTGRMRAKVSASPAHMMLRSPSLACMGVRPRGASSMVPPACATSAPSALVEPGREVPKSMTTAPSRSPAMTPSGPRIRPSTEAEVSMQSMTMSEACATSRALAASVAPRATAASMRGRETLPSTVRA